MLACGRPSVVFCTGVLRHPYPVDVLLWWTPFPSATTPLWNNRTYPCLLRRSPTQPAARRCKRVREDKKGNPCPGLKAGSTAPLDGCWQSKLGKRESRHEAKLMKLAVMAATLGLIKSVVDLAKSIIDWIRH